LLCLKKSTGFLVFLSISQKWSHVKNSCTFKPLCMNIFKPLGMKKNLFFNIYWIKSMITAKQLIRGFKKFKIQAPHCSIFLWTSGRSPHSVTISREPCVIGFRTPSPHKLDILHGFTLAPACKTLTLWHSQKLYVLINKKDVLRCVATILSFLDSVLNERSCNKNCRNMNYVVIPRVNQGRICAQIEFTH